MIAKRVVSVFKARGLAGVMEAVVRRIKMPHARSFPQIRDLVKGRHGIEIGGPSPIFAVGGLVPVYSVVERIDNVNFARRTLWEDSTRAGDLFHFHPRRAPGHQFVAEGANLNIIPNESYEFVLSSHMLEHTANPLRTLTEWSRLLKPGGALVLIVPARDGTFDHRRPVTQMSHLIQDFKNGTGEDDLTHLPEVLELHDLAIDWEISDYDKFRERTERNVELRSIHHHVFDTRLAVNTVQHTGFELVAVEPFKPYHILIVASKPSGGLAASSFDENALRKALRKSPFPSDHQNS